MRQLYMNIKPFIYCSTTVGHWGLEFPGVLMVLHKQATIKFFNPFLYLFTEKATPRPRQEFNNFN